MLDQAIRARLRPGLDRLARRISPSGRCRGRWLVGGWSCPGLSPGALTAAGLLAGVGACASVALGSWWVALGLWLLNRLLDGLDGPLARHRGVTELGGLLDFVADFVVYSGFIVAVAIVHPGARLACVALLATYLVNNVALLAFSSVIERLGLRLGDERSLRLTTGLVEGTETFAVYVLFCVLPAASETIAWAFAAVVAVTAVQRVVRAAQILNPRSSRGAQLRSTSTQSDA